jgi:hypothetical protein
MNEADEQVDVLAEGRELLAIFIQSAKTTSDNHNRQWTATTIIDKSAIRTQQFAITEALP